MLFFGGSACSPRRRTKPHCAIGSRRLKSSHVGGPHVPLTLIPHHCRTMLRLCLIVKITICPKLVYASTLILELDPTHTKRHTTNARNHSHPPQSDQIFDSDFFETQTDASTPRFGLFTRQNIINKFFTIESLHIHHSTASIGQLIHHHSHGMHQSGPDSTASSLLYLRPFFQFNPSIVCTAPNMPCY